MGLDTTIRTKKGEDLAYFRKDWLLQQWWIDYARIHYRDLANKWTGDKPIEETDGINREYYKKIYEEGDYNCVDIPITKESWNKFMDDTLKKHGWIVVCGYAATTAHIYNAIDDGEEVVIHGWW